MGNKTKWMKEGNPAMVGQPTSDEQLEMQGGLNSLFSFYEHSRLLLSDHDSSEWKCNEHIRQMLHILRQCPFLSRVSSFHLQLKGQTGSTGSTKHGWLLISIKKNEKQQLTPQRFELHFGSLFVGIDLWIILLCQAESKRSNGFLITKNFVSGKLLNSLKVLILTLPK